MAEEADTTFRADYAASDRSKCTRCRQAIAKDELRIGPMVQSPKGDFKYPQWHHFTCFEDGWLKKKPDALKSTNAVGGIDKLKFEDQKKIKGLVVGGDSTLETKATTEEEKALAAESRVVWNTRKKLEELTNGELQILLDHNNQPYSGKVFGGQAKMLDRCADGMVFGATPKCSVCKNGDFVFSHGEYKCIGAMDEFARCEFKTKDITRLPWKIPRELQDDYDFLRSYKFKNREKLTTTVVAEKDENSMSGPPAAAGADDAGKEAEATPAPSDKPLRGMIFAACGRLGKTQAQLETMIVELGGTFSKSAKDVTACIMTPAEASGTSAKSKEAIKGGALCVSEEYLAEVAKTKTKPTGAALEKLVLVNPKVDKQREERAKIAAKYELEKAAQEQRAALEETHREQPKSKRANVEGVKTVVIKGSAAVEVDSGLVETGHVYEPRPKEVWTATMSLADVASGKNSFYILQLIEHDNKKKWSVFRKWGKTGDDSIGGTKLTDYPLLSAATREFEKVYFDKTANQWANRHNFKKQYGKFMPLEMDYEEPASADGKATTPQSNAYTGSLCKATQDLMTLIFDIRAMTDALKEMEIDTAKLPLGKLSKNTIAEGFKCLNELQKVIDDTTEENKAVNRARIVSLTNKFYTFVPHAQPVGNASLPMLDDVEGIKKKVELVTALQEMEVASKIISSGAVSGAHPIDANYAKLKTDLREVKRGTDHFKQIEEYVRNTHGKTHTSYTLNLKDLWEVDREGEGKRFEPWKDDKNRMLLWHGSRLTNWVGILSQGLRIAPPEAPATGYMFGKGVYFADMVTKSANYCFTTSDKNTGIMMLCEVALGDMYKLKGAKYVDKLATPFKSTMGMGRYHPDPKEEQTMPNGTKIPMGKGVDAGIHDTTLLYNEFIVYDVAQIRTRYLLKLDFQYKTKTGTFF